MTVVELMFIIHPKIRIKIIKKDSKQHSLYATSRSSMLYKQHGFYTVNKISLEENHIVLNLNASKTEVDIEKNKYNKIPLAHILTLIDVKITPFAIYDKENRVVEKYSNDSNVCIILVRNNILVIVID